MDIIIEESSHSPVRPFDAARDERAGDIASAVRVAERRSKTRGRQRMTTRALAQDASRPLTWVIQDIDEAPVVITEVRGPGRDASL